MRDAIKSQVLSTFTRVAASSPCAALYLDPGRATCVPSTTQSSIDLQAVLDQINSNPAVTTTVGTGTTLWIQAWGGQGGNGADIGGLGNEGNGGDHGYAQATTTVAAINQAFGTTQLYYYLGRPGNHGAQSGGDGGTATFVASVDATTAVDLSKTLLVAAGSGGGGAGNSRGSGGCNFELGLTGGGGAVAISPVGAQSKVSGDDGQGRPNTDYSGQGGGGGGGLAGGGGGVEATASSGCNAVHRLAADRTTARLV